MVSVSFVYSVFCPTERAWFHGNDNTITSDDRRLSGRRLLHSGRHYWQFRGLEALQYKTSIWVCSADPEAVLAVLNPFYSLQRLEVLAGFGISVTLAFLGFDIITHGLKHILEDVGGHEAHHAHHHNRISAGAVDFASLLAVLATLVSAFGLGNHERVGKVMHLAYIESLPGVLSNPAHLLTLSCAAFLLILPLISIKTYYWLDRGIAATMAIAMCALGARLVKTLGYMLLMSYQGPSASEVLRNIETDPAVSTIEEAKFWRVHYGLCIATLKLRVRGTDESLGRLRDRTTSLIRNRLGGGYGVGGQRWEVSMQLTLEKD